jgi:hypothetical protein
MQFMKQITEKRLIMALIAACLLILFQGYFTTQNIETADDSEAVIEEKAIETVHFTASSSQANVIYICRLGNEQIPAVQISEVKDADGQVTETIATVDNGSQIEINARGAVPKWDYKSISARSGESLIEVAYSPHGNRQEDDWILTLKDENTYLKERVTGCMEVSDE